MDTRWPALDQRRTVSAVDAAFRHAWRGFSNDEFDKVVGLRPQETGISVGTGRAALVGGDGVVRDDSWIEVCEAASGLVAIVEACGPDYPDVLARALGYPDVDDEDGGALKVSSGELAIFSAAADGAGPYSVPCFLPSLDQCCLFTAHRLTRRAQASCSQPRPSGTSSGFAGTPNSTKTTASCGGSSFQSQPTTERGSATESAPSAA